MTIINAWTPETDVILHQALGKLAEECSELAQIATRCMIQGYAESDPVTQKLNRTQIMEEVADVRATMRWLFDVLDLPYKGESPREARKFDGYKAWEELLRSKTSPDCNDPSKLLTLSVVPAPPGWKLVPEEPTREMCEAPPALPAISAIDDLPLAKDGWMPKAVMNLKRYRAMISAAPSPAATTQQSAES